jgi:uncharacterized protein YecE (DUF72 family)
MSGPWLVGTCGFQKARRRHYESLDAVEVQQTFYDPPPPERLEAWAREAPEGFVFTVKAWMLITHGYNRMLWRRLRRSLPYPPEAFRPFEASEAVLWALNVTLEAARALNARAIVFQSPASFKASEQNAARVEAFFKEAGISGFEVYWEPRGSWWSPGEGARLLARVADRAGVNVAGDPLRGRLPPAGQETLYARLHGLGGRGEVNYRYKYTDADLERLLGIIKAYPRAYVMFNNVYAFEDAVRFRALLGGGGGGQR